MSSNGEQFFAVITTKITIIQAISRFNDKNI